MRRVRLLAGVPLAALLAVALAAAAPAQVANPGLPKGADPVTLDPADFSATIDNRQWPMTVGSRWVYRVTDMSNGETKRQVITVTSRTKLMADGITARVVRDVVTDHGKPVEVTDDWYAQDSHGNVWYFGEHTTSYEHGTPTDNGSWQAGVNGAMPGVALPAHPAVGLSYREEYSKGVAEDQITNETMLMRMVPELSNPPENIVKVAPDFWQPKTTASAMPATPKSGETGTASQ